MGFEKVQTYVFRKIRRFRERLIALRALERFVAVMHSFVNRESPHNGKPLPASGMITFVRFWWSGQHQVLRQSDDTYFLAYAVACVAVVLQLLRIAVGKPHIDEDGVPCETVEGDSINTDGSLKPHPIKKNKPAGADRSSVCS